VEKPKSKLYFLFSFLLFLFLSASFLLSGLTFLLSHFRPSLPLLFILFFFSIDASSKDASRDRRRQRRLRWCCAGRGRIAICHDGGADEATPSGRLRATRCGERGGCLGSVWLGRLIGDSEMSTGSGEVQQLGTGLGSAINGGAATACTEEARGGGSNGAGLVARQNSDGLVLHGCADLIMIAAVV
jgi:hypothetical protein